jgi:hypothetical protein
MEQEIGAGHIRSLANILKSANVLTDEINTHRAEEVAMAELRIADDQLVLHLTAAEKVESVHGDLHVPLSAVTGVEVIDDAHRRAGIRAGLKVGTRIPGLIEVATIRGRRSKIFAAVHHDTPRGLRVRLDGAPWDEWIVGCADPEAVAAAVAGPGQSRTGAARSGTPA